MNFTSPVIQLFLCTPNGLPCLEFSEECRSKAANAFSLKVVPLSVAKVNSLENLRRVSHDLMLQLKLLDFCNIPKTNFCY